MRSLLVATRPLNDVPGPIWLLLMVCLVIQCLFHGIQDGPETRKKQLSSPPATEVIRLAGISDAMSSARFVMLWLQAFDNQPGISLSFRELDYTRVTEWLDVVLQLDPRMQYPLLAAARVYGEVNDPDKQYQMITFIQQKFLEQPNARWSSMAHTVYIAKHKLGDMALARECARLLRLHATADRVPYWAKQMEFFVLEDMGELEAARILIGGLLESGELDDPQQQRFLGERLQQLEERIQQQAIE